MSDILDGIGTAAEGGLLSRAIEPNSGAREAHPDQPQHCLNCGTELVGAYCHACGQKGHLHRTIGAFLHELLHGVLHFEGRLWRTLPMLAFRPGRLTRRYIEGARARFISPMALFLFGVFLMFAVFQMLGLTAPTTIEAPDMDAVMVQVDEQTAARRDALQQELDAMAEDDPERAAIQVRLANLEATIEGIERVQGFGNVPDAARDFGDTGVAWLDETLIAKWRENPGLMLYKLQTNFYKFSWLLIPLSLPFVWLLFAWKRRFKAYDHTIFITYSLSFMTLLFVILSLLGKVGVPPALLFATVLLVPPIHLYKHLRGAYELQRPSAIWRLAVLGLCMWIVLILFLQLLLLLGTF